MLEHDLGCQAVQIGQKLAGFVRKGVLTGLKPYRRLDCLVVLCIRVNAKLGPGGIGDGCRVGKQLSGREDLTSII